MHGFINKMCIMLFDLKVQEQLGLADILLYVKSKNAATAGGRKRARLDLSNPSLNKFT